MVYALGALPGDAQIVTLRTAVSQDPDADVRWNAAVALARHGSADGVAGPPSRCSIGRTSSRPSSVSRVSMPDQDPMAEVMISGLRAAAALKVPCARSRSRKRSASGIAA